MENKDKQKKKRIMTIIHNKPDGEIYNGFIIIKNFLPMFKWILPDMTKVEVFLDGTSKVIKLKEGIVYPLFVEKVKCNKFYNIFYLR